MNTGHSITQAAGTPELDQVLTQNNVTSNSIVFTGPSAIYAPYSESTLGNLNLTNLSTDDSMPLLAINGSGDVVFTGKTISDIVSEASSALVESQGLDSVLTNNAYSGNTMYLTNTGNSLVTSGTIQVGGDVITTNGNVSARMLHASYSACTDTFLANQAFITSLRVTGNTAAQFNGSINVANTITGNVVSNLVDASTVVAKDIVVSGQASFDGITTVSVLKFAPGGIDIDTGATGVIVSAAAGTITVNAGSSKYGSNVINCGSAGTISGFAITNMVDNGHIYLHASNINLGTLSTSGVKYICDLTAGTYSDVMFHIFKIVGGLIYVDVKQLA
jgi:hypothetical protein